MLLNKRIQSIRNKIKKSWGAIISIALIVILYIPLLHKYFEQDEWHNFGWQIYTLSNMSLTEKLLSLLTSNLPTVQLFNFLNYYIFGVNNVFPAISVLILIISNSIVWYILVKKITKDSFIACLSILFGFVNVLSLQSVSWVIPAVASQLSFLFSTLAIVTVYSYVKTSKKVNLLYAILFSILAFTSRHNAIFIVFYLPLFYLLISPKVTVFKLVQLLKSGLVITAAFMLFLWFKFGGLRFGDDRFVSEPIQMLVNFFVIPIKAISQLLFYDPRSMYVIGDWFVENRFGLQPNDIVVQSILTELLSIILSLFVILIVVLIGFTAKKYRKSLIIFSIYYYMSFMPYIVDKFSTGTGFLESRYYQMGAFGLGVIVAIVLKHLISVGLKFKNRYYKWSMLLLIVSIAFVYLFFSYATISDELYRQVDVTTKRKEVLQAMKNTIVTNAGKNFIIYVNDRGIESQNPVTNMYYQTGVLYPLLVLSYDSGKIDPAFFEDDVLWDYSYTGTMIKNNQKIGIYYSRSDLIDAIKANNFSIEDVYSYTFDYSDIPDQGANGFNVNDFTYVKYKDSTQETRDSLLLDNK